jgi:hypothetical protein
VSPHESHAFEVDTRVLLDLPETWLHDMGVTPFHSGKTYVKSSAASAGFYPLFAEILTMRKSRGSLSENSASSLTPLPTRGFY